MSVPTPRRTIEDIDHELVRHRWLLERALQRMAANSAELAMIRIEQLLDERLKLRAPVA